MDDALLVSVLNGFAHLLEERQPISHGQPMAIAVRRDRLTLHILHDEERPAVRRCPAVEHGSDRGVHHQREGLPFSLEAGDDVLRLHAGLDDLQGDEPLDRPSLLCEPHFAHPAAAEELNEPVGAVAAQPALRRQGRRGGSARDGQGTVIVRGLHDCRV